MPASKKNPAVLGSPGVILTAQTNTEGKTGAQNSPSKAMLKNVQGVNQIINKAKIAKNKPIVDSHAGEIFSAIRAERILPRKSIKKNKASAQAPLVALEPDSIK